MFDTAPCSILRRVRYRTVFDTAPCSIPHRGRYRTAFDTAPCSIPQRVRYRSNRNYISAAFTTPTPSTSRYFDKSILPSQEMTHHLEKKSVRWEFIESLESPRVVHVRTTTVVSKDNLYAQVTVRFHTKQVGGAACNVL